MTLLRRMRWWDIAAVHEVETRVFPDDSWTPGQFWSELAGVPETRYYVVARADLPDKALLGYAGLFCIPPDADVQTVAVSPEHMGQGLGRCLLEDLEREARNRGATRLTLEVRADNQPAKALYLSAGFEQIAIRPRYYGEHDALIMQKRLV